MFDVLSFLDKILADEKIPTLLSVCSNDELLDFLHFYCKYTNSMDSFTSLYIRSLNHNFLEKIRIEIEKMDGVIGVSYNQDLPDCRRSLAIAFTPNKKGNAAKKQIVATYFDKDGNLIKQI